MSSFLRSSIGQKLLMGITGFFLIMFLLVHLTVNSFLLFDSSGELFNVAAHFMATYPPMRIMELTLALGFVVHIIYAAILTLQNRKSRPESYKIVNQKETSKWASRNMFVLGALVLTFLVIHLVNFYIKLKTGHTSISHVPINGVNMEDAYTLVQGLFEIWWYVVIYVIGAVFLGLHLHHAFWSAFQTLGWSNDLWRKRLATIGNIYAVIVPCGFAFIAIFFLIKSMI